MSEQKSSSAKKPTSSKKTIGLILPFSPYIFGSDYYVALMLGMVGTFHKSGYEIRLMMTPTHPCDEWGEYRSHTDIDGYLIVGDIIPQEFISIVHETGIPVVLVNNRGKGNEISSVCCDNFNSAYDAVTYLAAIGHKRIGMFRGLASASDAKDRFSGYKEALAENCLEYDESIVYEGDFSEVSGYRCMLNLIEDHKDNLPGAIFSANDDMAIGALNAMKEKNISCPGDIAIVGFDNIRASSLVTPALTTVNQPVLEMGTQAAMNLTELIKGSKQPPLISILPTELIIRQSCGVDGGKPC